MPALSQTANPGFLEGTDGFELSRWNTFEVDENGQTNIPGVFSGGDIATGPDIAIRAVAGGRTAAKGIHEYLSKS